MDDKFILDQKKNYNADFGKVYRAASTLYYVQSQENKINTTITFMNYWSIKNNLDVKVLANTRKMNGQLIYREELEFKNGNVINYSPKIEDEFEGSIEIEIISLQNLRFPYPAIMVSYEGISQSSMTHTYGRVYSAHEIEDKKIIPFGYESGWTIRDSDNLSSFCVLHNGNEICPEQNIEICIRMEGEENKKKIKHKLKQLNAYETVKLYTKDLFPEVISYLNGSSGNIELSFTLKNAFTRLLVGHEATKDRSLQVTHSNFNYNKIQTDIVENSNAIYAVPNLNFKNFNAIIYPGRTRGKYRVETSNKSYSLDNQNIIKFPVKGGERLIFSGENNRIPSRIVLGLEYGDNNIFLSELSSNIFHKNKPPKRFHWGNLLPSNKGESKLIFTDLRELFGGIKDSNIIIIRFYNSKSKSYVERKYSGNDYKNLEVNGFNILADSEIKNFIGEEIGWWSIFSDYGGLYPFILVKDGKNQSYTLEHAF